jgi:hypothetical protein
MAASVKRFDGKEKTAIVVDEGCHSRWSFLVKKRGSLPLVESSLVFQTVEKVLLLMNASYWPHRLTSDQGKIICGQNYYLLSR